MGALERLVERIETSGEFAHGPSVGSVPSPLQEEQQARVRGVPPRPVVVSGVAEAGVVVVVRVRDVLAVLGSEGAPRGDQRSHHHLSLVLLFFLEFYFLQLDVIEHRLDQFRGMTVEFVEDRRVEPQDVAQVQGLVSIKSLQGFGE